MATIAATCGNPHCGLSNRDLQVQDVVVRILSKDNSGTYEFKCLWCDEITCNPADDRTVDILIRAGCPTHMHHVPKEVEEREVVVTYAAPLTEEDVTNFLIDINDDRVTNVQMGFMYAMYRDIDS